MVRVNPPLDEIVQIAESGKIILTKTGELRRRNRIRTIPGVYEFRDLIDSFWAAMHSHILPDSLMPYQGIIRWFREPGTSNVQLYAMKTREGTTLQDMLKLYGEFENVAVQAGAKRLRTQIVQVGPSREMISDKVMKRFGWYYIGSNINGWYYEKPV